MDIDHIWQEYRVSLQRFLRSKVSNPADVEDLLQNILLKTHQNLKELHSVENVKPWLFQIANRTIIDFYRRQASRPQLNSDDLWYEEGAGHERELAKCVAPFIQSLPEKYTDLLQSVEIEGVSQKEYAKTHEISYSTLKSRVQKARYELKNRFLECCDIRLDSRGNAIDCHSGSDDCGTCGVLPKRSS